MNWTWPLDLYEAYSRGDWPIVFLPFVALLGAGVVVVLILLDVKHRSA